ncbi:MAG TPA: magnesium transporter, partial [Armatimonadetes bacterium]|nr:magnesium transporter [Armatimonadota bacterium]
ELRILIQLRHQVAPMRDQLNSLLRRDQGCIPDEMRDDFADVYAHTYRI